LRDSGKDGGLQPILLETPNYLEKALQILGLLDVAICAGSVTAVDIAWVGGTGENDDGNCLEILVALDFIEDLATVRAGKIQVEQDHPWGSGFPRASVWATPIQIVEGVIAVSAVDDAFLESRLVKPPDDDLEILRIVL
jgi:hypothetical protein